MAVPGADTTDAGREFRLARGEHEREKTMGHQVAQRPCAIRIILAPAEIGIRIKRLFIFDRRLPFVPIQIRGLTPGLNGIIPFTVLAIAAIISLGPNRCANFASGNQLRRLMPGGGGATLGANLNDFAGFLRGVVQVKSFLQIAGHRLFNIKMLAGFESGDGRFAMPMVNSGDGYGVDVLVGEQLLVVFVEFASAADYRLGVLLAVVGKIAGGHLDDIIGGGIRVLNVNVRHALAAGADVSDLEAVVGPDNAAGRRSLILPIAGGLKDIGAGRHGGSREG